MVKPEPLGWLSIGEAAKYLGLSKDTLRRWEKKGKIKCYRTPSGRRRYTMHDLELAMQTPKAFSFPTPRQAPKQRREISMKESPTPKLAAPTKPVVTHHVKRDIAALNAAPKPIKFSTLAKLLLIIILTFFALSIFSGVGELVATYLKSTKEVLSPIPKTYFRTH